MEQPKVTEKRFEIGFHIFNQWMYLKQRGVSLKSYFTDNMIESIAIYGMGALGERLYEELQNSGLFVKYAIDWYAEFKNIPGLKIYNANEEMLPPADAIVVTPIQDYWAIVELLEKKTEAAVVSLGDIIEYCMSGE